MDSTAAAITSPDGGSQAALGAGQPVRFDNTLREVSVYLKADKVRPPTANREVYLGIACSKGQMRLFIDWGTPVSRKRRILAQVAFDNRGEEEIIFRRSGKAVIVPQESTQMLNQLLSAQELQISVPERGKTASARFSLANLPAMWQVIQNTRLCSPNLAPAQSIQTIATRNPVPVRPAQPVAIRNPARATSPTAPVHRTQSCTCPACSARRCSPTCNNPAAQPAAVRQPVTAQPAQPAAVRQPAPAQARQPFVRPAARPQTPTSVFSVQLTIPPQWAQQLPQKQFKELTKANAAAAKLAVSREKNFRKRVRKGDLNPLEISVASLAQSDPANLLRQLRAAARGDSLQAKWLLSDAYYTAAYGSSRDLEKSGELMCELSSQARALPTELDKTTVSLIGQRLEVLKLWFAAQALTVRGSKQRQMQRLSHELRICAVRMR